ncbi:MAG: hypothetical protein QOE02_4502 [Rhodospirillaceae bacterium]|nr:hypothetical protein [Rhodospirillaceae bacterium]
MDARRLANKQGLTLKGPKKVYYARPANAGMLYAQKHGVFRARCWPRQARRPASPRSWRGAVPGTITFVFEGELFWGGDRIGLLRERLDEKGVKRCLA